jgi:FtsP/CotA-like multicopper oxidase with cupredoxin domain
MYPEFLGEGEFPNTKQDAVPPGLYSGCKASNGSTEVFKVDAADKWVALHFVSAMSLKIGVVSVDEHPMWVYAVDGQYVKPQFADSFILHNGERISAMVKLDKTPGDYTIRVANNLPNQLISGYAKMSYAHGLKMNGSTPFIDYGSKNVSSAVRPLDDDLLVPFNSPPPAPYANQTIFLALHRVGYNWQWTLNNKTAFGMDRENIAPLLLSPNATDPTDSTLVIQTKNNTWVDIIFQVTLGPENMAQPVHAMHKHSNRMYLIGRGVGPFVWPTVAEAQKHIPESFFSLATAQYRDTIVTTSTIFKPSWTAMRYHVQNPGAFILHCHMMTHLQGGMAVVLMDGVDAWPTIPQKYRGT